MIVEREEIGEQEASEWTASSPIDERLLPFRS